MWYNIQNGGMMKRIFFMSLTSLVLLTGCGSKDNELLTAIENSYDLKTGSIESNFEYTTEYNNIDIEGTVAGKIKVLFGDQYSKVTADIIFEDDSENIEYYVDGKDNIISNDFEHNVSYTPLFTEAPNIGDSLTDSIPVPTAETIEINNTEIKVDTYEFDFNTLDTKAANTIFDPVIKLGFVSTEILQSEQIDGDFSLTYYVDPTTDKLVKECFKYNSQEENSLSTNTTVEISNIYDYSETTVELPAGYGDQTTSDVESSEQE